MINIALTQRSDLTLLSFDDGKNKLHEDLTGNDFESSARAVGAFVANIVSGRVPLSYNATDINVVFRKGQ